MIKPENLKVESTKQTPKGGQHVGVISAGVKVTHIPTGLSASCEYGRSQRENKDIATSMIEWGLLELGISDQP